MGQLSHREDVPFPIFDADNHLYEPPEALTKFLPKEYKDFVQYVQINGRTKIAIRGQISNYIPNPTFEVVARPGAWEEYFKYGNPDGKSKRELFGEPMRAIPAFFEPGPRLEKMNELGLDRTLMFRKCAEHLLSMAVMSGSRSQRRATIRSVWSARDGTGVRSRT